MTLIGYARVSTADQEPASQIDALRAAGCSTIHMEHVSATAAHRPELEAALAELREGDTLVVWRLDRLARSLTDLVAIIETLGGRGIEFRSLTEALDTSTPSGRLLFHVSAAFAQYEREIVRERTAAGLEAARRAGRYGGRPTVMSAQRTATACRLLSEGQSIASIARTLGVGASSVRRALAREPRVPGPEMQNGAWSAPE